MAQPCISLVSLNGANRAFVQPSGEIKVSVASVTLLNDPFDGTTLDTTYRWNQPVVAGAGSVTQNNGLLVMSVGTGASSAAALSSIETFGPVVPGWLDTRGLVFMENNPSINTHRFVGQGTPNSGSYTAATPLQDGWGWEYDITGSLNACVYSGGVRTFKQSFPVQTSALVPTIFDSWLRQNVAYFFLNNLEEPVASAPFPNPNTTTLPYRAHVINHTSGPAVAPVWNVTQATVIDTGNNYQTNFNGQTVSRTRTPAKFVNLSAVSIAAEATIWAPASGRRFRLMGYVLESTGTGIGNVILKDNTAGTTILVIPFGATNTVIVSPPMGNGILSSTANNVLTATGGIVGQTLSGYVFGTEE